mmetsp:Transcript_11842/g.37609  ORF Transcript_11842/g.37609 Transcript_11842/m.37609 type:complete len:210 (-) Transcript_11842:25-654(-)
MPRRSPALRVASSTRRSATLPGRRALGTTRPLPPFPLPLLKRLAPSRSTRNSVTPSWTLASCVASRRPSRRPTCVRPFVRSGTGCRWTSRRCASARPKMTTKPPSRSSSALSRGCWSCAAASCRLARSLSWSAAVATRRPPRCPQCTTSTPAPTPTATRTVPATRAVAQPASRRPRPWPRACGATVARQSHPCNFSNICTKRKRKGQQQ